MPGKSTQDLVDARGIEKFCNANKVAAEVTIPKEGAGTGATETDKDSNKL